MTNLSKAFSTSIVKGKFYYSLNGKKEINNQNPSQYTVLNDFTRQFHYQDEVNFDANLRAFLIENSEILTNLDKGIKIDFLRGSNVFYFSIISI
jgi:hypothetical protein